VALADLSEKPRPPSLGSALRRHYPVDARQRGVGGTATVKARVEPDGRVRKVELVSETFPGFGDACRRTLTGSEWSPPRDREGRAVSTAIRYTCRFVVQP
jgi:TonB family protein